MADDMMDTLEAVDACAVTRNQLRKIAASVEEWAGIPFTTEGGPGLIVEPSYPWASVFQREQPAEEATTDKVRAVFWSMWRRSEILMIEKADGRVTWGQIPRAHSLDLQLATMASASVWGVEQEQRALQLLGTMLRHHQFKSYLLTGMFIERSPRSDIAYIFRRLRPTVAISTHGRGFSLKQDGRARILASLCLHPIGYYEGSWAGAMCPTDDVVAHLALMRADEHMFWRRANQHPPYRPEAAI